MCGPFRSGDGVLDVAVFVSGDAHWPIGVEGAHVAHPYLFHDAARGSVHEHRLGHDTFNTKHLEAVVDQRARAFGAESVAPRKTVQSVAELGFEWVGAVVWASS